MSFLDGLFSSRSLFMLTGGDGNAVHLGFVAGRKAAFFFTTQEKAAVYIRATALRAGLAKVNWRAFEELRAGLIASHVRQAAINPEPGQEDAALILPLEQVYSENPAIWG